MKIRLTKSRIIVATTTLAVVGGIGYLMRPKPMEVDTALVKRSRLFVDSRVSALNEAGDVLIPIQEGEITPDHIEGEIGEIIAGPRAVHRKPSDVTLFKSLGLAVEDIAAARFVFERAEERGAGIMIDLGGRRDATA